MWTIKKPKSDKDSPETKKTQKNQSEVKQQVGLVKIDVIGDMTHKCKEV